MTKIVPGRFAAGRLLAVKAVTDGDEGGIGIELEFDCAACALRRVLLCHVLGLLFDWQASVAFPNPTSSDNRDDRTRAQPLLNGRQLLGPPDNRVLRRQSAGPD